MRFTNLHSHKHYLREAMIDLKKKFNGSRALWVSHIEELENVVLLHKVNSNANLVDVKSSVSSNAGSIEVLLTEEATKGLLIFNELQSSLSTQQGEMEHFARETTFSALPSLLSDRSPICSLKSISLFRLGC